MFEWGINWVMRVLAKIYVVVFALTILLAISSSGGRFFGFAMSDGEVEHGKKIPFALDEAKIYLPGAASISVLDEDEAEVLDSGGRMIGRLIHTQPQTRHIIGYGASLPLVVVLNSEEKVSGLFLQAHQESPDFIARLESLNFFKNWNGLTASEAIAAKVDAVSRATLTTQAVIDSVRLRLANHIKVDLERKKIDYVEIARSATGWLFLLISLLACYNRSGVAKYRTWILLAAILVPGFLLGRFVSLELIVTWAANGIPYQAQLFMATVMLLALGLPILSGRAWYCSWFCPFGAAQELTGKLCKRKIDGGAKFVALARLLRPLLMLVVVFLLLVGNRLNLNLIEPFSVFLLDSAAACVIWLALVFIVLSLFMRRPWCGCFCPTGVLLEVLRFPQVFQEKREPQQEAGKMKFVEVINLLLVIVIIMQVLSSSRMVQSQPNPSLQGNQTALASAQPSVQTAQPQAVASVNPVLQNIHQRKSVRNFTSQEVSEEQLVELVRAGMAAPTAVNRQPWQFVVIRDKKAMLDLAGKLPYAKMLASAAAAIVVCGDLEIAKVGKTEGMWMLDCSAATQNILLAVESMGLGAVWTAAYPYDDRMQAVSTALSLPEHVLPLCVLPIGYPTGMDKPKDKWKPERMHWNSWQPGK
ncbi:MAG: nitroreductase family protein [Candidatus Riflebacteria bacterium]|nr:nitroreductase family protein [Candidatus Riflebacteria bacterium]